MNETVGLKLTQRLRQHDVRYVLEPALYNAVTLGRPVTRENTYNRHLPLAAEYLVKIPEQADLFVHVHYRLIDLGCEVKNGAKKETPVCYDAIDWLKYDLQVSKDGLAWLASIVDAAKDDLTTYDILKEYYKDEESDMYWAEQQLELIKTIGKENWYASMM